MTVTAEFPLPLESALDANDVEASSIEQQKADLHVLAALLLGSRDR